MPAERDFYQKSVNEIYKELNSSRQGLPTHIAGRRLKKYGLNEQDNKVHIYPLIILLNQLKSPLIYVLIGALVVTALLGDLANSIVIALAVFINTILGFIQEYKAQNTLHALSNIFSPKARVLRGGSLLEIEPRYLVPGDIIPLNMGQKVPADARVIETSDLKVNESFLTGESEAVDKHNTEYRTEKMLAERKNMVYSGSSVLSGSGKAIVVATGPTTEIGKIAKSVANIGEDKTPLQKSLDHIGKVLVLVFMFTSLLVFVAGVAFKRSVLEMFITAVALAVAAIPEGLATSLTVILAIGMQRIFKRKALVRKLLAAETLGSVTTICTDKTGTLTEGNMKVVSWKLTDMIQAIKAATLCNDLNNQTEIALWEKLITTDHYDPEKVKENYERLAVVPFGSEKKYMAVLIKENGDLLIYAKGAPEVLITWCKMGIVERDKWQSIIETWGKKGLRVIALAYKYKDLSKKQRDKIEKNGAKDFLHKELESGFTFLGLAALTDPIRESVGEAITSCKKAGIKVSVITGDFRATAETIMNDLGFKLKPEEIMEGAEISKISPDDLKRRVSKIRLFARVTPMDKLKIVTALKEINESVAMTGDGTNDAPALKSSNIGIVVKDSTEVARGAGDIILLDSNFQTIVSAIEEGRVIFDNIRKVTLYLLSDCFSEILLIAASLFMNLPLPLTAAQILWINLITDGLPNLALTIDPKRNEVMNEPPRKPDEKIITGEMGLLILFISTSIGLFALVVFYAVYKITQDLEAARTLTFATLGASSLLYVFSCKNLRKSIFKDKNGFNNKALIIAVLGGLAVQFFALYIPLIRNFLHLRPLNLLHWIIVLTFSFLVIIGIEIVKWIYNRKYD